jgi:hypothetical protein
LPEKKGLYIGLVHYPVYNKHKEIVVTSITTIDLHDFSRIARTYGIDRFYVVTPLKAQQELARTMFSHWMTGYGAGYNPTRKEAISRASVKHNIDEVLQEIESIHGKAPITIITGARAHKETISSEAARELIGKERPVLILFGTGWGLEKSLVDKADFSLAPIQGNADYNHLPVRAAAAIAIDRVLGDRF